MGQESSKGAAPGHSSATEPSGGIEAELARMLHFYNPRGDANISPPRHVQDAQRITASLKALPPPRPPLLPWSDDLLVVSRHERAVDDANRAPWSVFVKPIDDPSTVAPGFPAVAVPQPIALHRFLASWETADLDASGAVVANHGRLGEALKQLEHDAQVARSTTLHRAAEINRVAATLQATVGALGPAPIDAVQLAVSDIRKLVAEVEALLPEGVKRVEDSRLQQ